MTLEEKFAAIFSRAAEKCRARARDAMSSVDDHGVEITVSTPESVLHERNARLWEEIAKDLAP